MDLFQCYEFETVFWIVDEQSNMESLILKEFLVQFLL